MAHIYIKNSLNYNKTVLADVNVTRFVTTTSDGNPIYMVSVETTASGENGSIKPIFINNVDNSSLNCPVDNAVSKLMGEIDWGPLLPDNEAPKIKSVLPSGDSVPISSLVYIKIEDEVPSSGIDLSTMEVILETGDCEFDITNQCVVKGTPFEYDVYWRPTSIIQENYINSED